MRRTATALLGAALVTAPSLHAAPARFHGDLTRAVDALGAPAGPETYAALRQVWDTWDRADPTQVEEVLRAAEADASLPPPLRAYAGTLVAYARLRRGDFSGSKARLSRLGYVDRWLVVGPFDNESKAGLNEPFAPEADGVPDASKSYTGKERSVAWRKAADVFPYGYVDVGALLRPETKICAYAASVVRDAKDRKTARQVSLFVGAAGASATFWNGQRILTDTAYRGHDFDRQGARVTLRPGANLLTVKVCGDANAPVVSVRVGDERGGTDGQVKFSFDLDDAKSAAVNVTAAAPKPGPVTGKPSTVDLGAPLQAFTRLTSVPKPAARDLFAFAQYLAETGGDDPATHQARDLATRAAEQEPTVARLLLASQLAEDVNRARTWVEKASVLAAKRGQIDPEVAWAEAVVARQSPNWREAFPYYDRVLAADPGNVDALRGKVELYNDVGLRRTALGELERALAEHPRGVNLLNMTASELRALGRAAEAAELEDRYAGLRADDRSYTAQMIDLALVRRERSSAERWVLRLLELDPEAQWSHGVAARAYRRMGQPDRARATYQHALEIAPEDVATLRALADLEGELDQRAEQLALLRKILKLRPQDKETREYVENIEPPRPRDDEAWAWASDKFLKQRLAPAEGQNRRTLRDLTVTTVYPNGLSSKFRQVVYQPLTDAAAAAGRQYGFSYQADSEVVQLRQARVFRADGRVDEAVETGEGAADDPSISMYTSARHFYVQLPRLEPGDVVELQYRVDDVTPRNELADYFGEVSYMGSDDPSQNVEYVLSVPKARAIQVDARVPGVVTETLDRGDHRVYRFFAAKLAAITPEPGMPPWAEVLPRVHVSTYSTWQDVGTWYWGLAHEQFDTDEETRQLARKIGKDAKTDLEKVQAVYAWVTNNTRYVALEFGIYGYKPRRCVQTVTRGWGDCKDKATVIVTLLKELGVKSTIVILRTQMRGNFDSKIASLAPFDHAIAYVPALDLYLDGTAEHTGVYELPKMDLGALGLRINEGAAEIVTLPRHDPARNVVERQITAALDASGSAKLDLRYVTRGVDAPGWRDRYHAEGSRRDRVAGDLGREFPGFVLGTGAPGLVAHLDDVEKPVQIEAHGNAPGLARKEGKGLTLPVTTSTRLTPAFAALSRRTQAVRLLAFSTVDDVFTVKLPTGWHVSSAPPAAKVESRFGSATVEVEQRDGQVIVKSRVAIKVDRVEPAEYAEWQAFCAEVDRVLSPRLTVEP